MNYKEIEKRHQASFVYEVCQKLELKTCDNLATILGIVRSDVDFFYQKILSAECASNKPIESQTLNNFKFLLKQIAWKPFGIESNNLKKQCDLISKLFDAPEYFISDELFSKPDYIKIYAKKYKDKYPIDKKKAEKILSEVSLDFSSEGMQELISLNIFAEKKDFNKWVQKLFLRSDYIYLVGLHEAKNMFDIIKDFATPPMYDYFCWVCASELLTIAYSDDLFSYEEVDKKVRCLYEEMSYHKPKMDKYIIKILQSKVHKSYPVEKFVLDVFEEPSRALNYMNVHDEDGESNKMLEEMKAKYLALVEKAKLEGEIKLGAVPSKFKI